MYGFICGLCIVPAIHSLMLTPHCLDYCGFIPSFENQVAQLLQHCPFKIALFILGSFNFHLNFRINLSIYIKKPAGNFIGILLNLQIDLRKELPLKKKKRIAILTKWSLQIHEHSLSLTYLGLHYFLLANSQSFQHTASAPSVKLMPKYFVLFDYIINIFLTLFLYSELLIYIENTN